MGLVDKREDATGSKRHASYFQVAWLSDQNLEMNVRKSKKRGPG